MDAANRLTGITPDGQSVRFSYGRADGRTHEAALHNADRFGVETLVDMLTRAGIRVQLCLAPAHRTPLSQAAYH